MRLAIVGCGYVADFYMRTLANHPSLHMLGVMDRDEGKAARFAAFHSVHRYSSLEEILCDDHVELVVNLTNPKSHFEITRACLAAGKHVYSEKPLAMSFAEARTLVELAESRGLQLTCAPCSILGETAQTLWRALREQRIGTTRLVFAELSDGPVYLMRPQEWRSASGNPWPYQDEFEVGATLEHAAYYVSWLVAFFGSATRVTAFATCLAPDKGVPLDYIAPDFSVSCIEFSSGVLPRLTCDLFAPHDHKLRIMGDKGILSTPRCWDYGAPVYLQPRTPTAIDRLMAWAPAIIGIRHADTTARMPLALKMENYPRAAKWLGLGARRYPLVREPAFEYRAPGARPMDFARGIMELANAVAERRANRLSARYSLHVNEIVLAIHDPVRMGTPYEMSTNCESIEPMPWATVRTQ